MIKKMMIKTRSGGSNNEYTQPSCSQNVKMVMHLSLSFFPRQFLPDPPGLSLCPLSVWMPTVTDVPAETAVVLASDIERNEACIFTGTSVKNQ